MTSNLCPLRRAVDPAYLSAADVQAGRVLRDARRAYRCSTDTLAARLGIAERTVRRWQTGESPIDLVALLKFAPEIGQAVAESLKQAA